MKKINRCPDGGFVKLKNMVLQGGKPQCPACCEILEENDFKYEDLQKAVDALKAGLPAPVERGVRKYVFTKRKMEGKAAAKRRQRMARTRRMRRRRTRRTRTRRRARNNVVWQILSEIA